MGNKKKSRVCTSLPQLGNWVMDFVEGRSFLSYYRKGDSICYNGAFSFQCGKVDATLFLETIKERSYTSKIISYKNGRKMLKGKFTVANATTYHGGDVRLHTDHNPQIDGFYDPLEMAKNIGGVKYLYSVENNTRILEEAKVHYLPARDSFRRMFLREIADLEGIVNGNGRNGHRNHSGNNKSRNLTA